MYLPRTLHPAPYQYRDTSSVKRYSRTAWQGRPVERAIERTELVAADLRCRAATTRAHARRLLTYARAQRASATESNLSLDCVRARE